MFLLFQPKILAIFFITPNYWDNPRINSPHNLLAHNLSHIVPHIMATNNWASVDLKVQYNHVGLVLGEWLCHCIKCAY